MLEKEGPPLSGQSLAAPYVVAFDAAAGSGRGFSDHYENTFGDLKGVYRDAQAFEALLETSAELVAYEVLATTKEDHAGELIVGTSTVRPGRVGDEYYMTRGHIHQIHERAEMYLCTSGHGVMLLESLDGDVEALEMRSGQMVYVPGGWIHRSVNVGVENLVTLFCYGADAGQDYTIIERSNGMAKLVVEGAQGAWQLRDNPDYVARNRR